MQRAAIINNYQLPITTIQYNIILNEGNRDEDDRAKADTRIRLDCAVIGYDKE
jgi:hypothetical protein